MGGGEAGLPSDDVECSHRLDDSDESESVDDLAWSPGDGICPSTAQFNQCYQSKFSYWRNAASTHKQDLESHLLAFLHLLKHVPPFFHDPPAGVDIAGRPGSHLMLKLSLQIQTTEDSDCDQPCKSVKFLQLLGSPSPAIYTTKAETQLQVAIPISSAKPLRSGYFTSIVLAWSYIISCRWVEILQVAGEKSQIFHYHEGRLEDSFWDIVTQSCWVAQIKRQNGTFYSPWMLRKEGTTKIDTRKGNWTSVPPNSALAFDILLDNCVSEGLEEELLTGLASVLMLTSRNAPPPKFALPMNISVAAIRSSSNQQNTEFHKLFQSIDKCMFLSSTQDALDSLLCSVFFDASVPCNFLGAASLGAREALSGENQVVNEKQILSATTNLKPHLTLLWAAVLCTDQANCFLNLATRSLPPICLVTALCTNTAQSFLQVEYHNSDNSEELIVSRANEFQTSYFCRPDITVPWSPAPPFGSTPIENLSLDIKAHLAHRHRPISWTICWILNSGERVPGSSRHQLKLEHVHNVYYSCSDEHFRQPPHPQQHTADEQSGIATSRLFNWHRGYDDGIWLDDGKGDIELIRRLQRHGWIIDQFDIDDNEPVEERKMNEVRAESILRWTNDVEEYRQLGEFGKP